MGKLKIQEPSISPKFKLPKKFKAKWIQALRSGKYKQQGEGELLNENEDNGFKVGYCCLGVAAAACGIGKRSLLGRSFLYDSLASYKKLPNSILIPQISLNMSDKERMARDIQHQLAEFNDSGKYSFKEIASWINKHL